MYQSSKMKVKQSNRHKSNRTQISDSNCKQCYNEVNINNTDDLVSREQNSQLKKENMLLKEDNQRLYNDMVHYQSELQYYKSKCQETNNIQK